MRAVKADVTSSKPISLSQAHAILSLFAASETGARPDVAAYLRRAATAFEELVSVHREIRYERKVSQKDVGELAEEDSRRRKKKNNKEGDSHGGNSILEKQGSGVLFIGNLGSAPVEANGVVEEKKVKEKEKRKIVGSVTKSNGVVENKKEKEKKKKVKEERENEMKGEEVEYNVKRSEKRKNQKENKQKEGRLLEGGMVGLVSDESIASERKKRKHSDVEQGGMDGKIEQHGGNGKKKRRKA